MLKITPHDIKCGIKYGLGVDGFCTKYGCTQEKFEEIVRSFYHESSSKILKEIHDSARHGNKRPKSGKAKGSATMNGLLDAPMGALEDAPVGGDADKLGNEVETELEELRAKLLALSDEIMACEGRYMALLTQHKANLGCLRDIQKKLNELEASFKALCDEYERMVQSDNLLVAEMNEISEARRIKIGVINPIRERIRVLETVTLCAYNNGTIAIFEGPSMELNDTGAEEFFSQIVTLPECENLTVRDIRLVARMSCIVKNASAPTEVLFEQEEVGRVYSLFAAEDAAQ